MDNSPNPQNLVDTWLERLAESGYRMTSPRRVIVETVAITERALSPLDIFDLARKDYPGLGLVTVYRTLEKLEELELVERVHQQGGCHMYLRACQGHQHLLLCTKCGRAEYFSGDNISSLMDRIALQSGYEIKDHWLQLFGLCALCQNNGSEK